MRVLSETGCDARVYKYEIESKGSRPYNYIAKAQDLKLLKGLETINKRQESPNYTCRTNILDRLEDKHEQVQQQENDSR